MKLLDEDDPIGSSIIIVPIVAAVTLVALVGLVYVIVT